jgi:IgGFc binding protein
MSSATFTIRPVSTLGTQYMVTGSALGTFYGLFGLAVSNTGPFAFAVAAAYDNTRIIVNCFSTNSTLSLSNGANLRCSNRGNITISLQKYQGVEVGVNICYIFRHLFFRLSVQSVLLTASIISVNITAFLCWLSAVHD